MNEVWLDSYDQNLKHTSLMVGNFLSSDMSNPEALVASARGLADALTALGHSSVLVTVWWEDGGYEEV